MTVVARCLLAACSLLLPVAASAQQPSVRMEPPQLNGSREVEKQTETAVVRDYLQAWQTMATALNTNDPAVLASAFVGNAQDRLTETVAEQVKAGVHTRYQDISHDLRFVFYSPEGQSIQLTDTVEYKQQVFAGDKLISTQMLTGRYVVVMTPAEVRWRVRVLQGQTGQ